MTKKHFVALAEVIREYNSTAFWGTDANGVRGKQNIPVQGDLLNALASFCQSQNAQFDRDRFLAACGVSTPTEKKLCVLCGEYQHKPGQRC